LVSVKIRFVDLVTKSVGGGHRDAGIGQGHYAAGKHIEPPIQVKYPAD